MVGVIRTYVRTDDIGGDVDDDAGEGDDNVIEVESDGNHHFHDANVDDDV